MRRLVLWLTPSVAACAALAYLLFFQTGDGYLRRFSGECIGCHVSNTLQLNGRLAAGFSRGVHGVNPGLPIQSDGAWEKPVLTGKECSKCHPEVYKTWSTGNHSKAFSNEIFRTALKLESLRWCLHCHGPLWNEKKVDLKTATEAQKPLGELHEAGVTCVVCHMREGKIHTRGAHEIDQTKIFHRLYRDKKLGASEFCAGCHQFNFPKTTEPVVTYAHSTPMQNTVTEYENVTGGNPPCHSCHIDGKDHSLHPKGELQKTLQYSIKTVKSDELSSVTFSIRLENLGHHFPTGDLFRILSLYVYDARHKEIFKKDYRKEVRVADRQLVADSTLVPAKGTLVAADTATFITRAQKFTCAIVYRRQGSLENQPKRLPLPAHVHRTVIYEGPCETLSLMRQ
jgi:hypothetical protein